MVRLKRRVHPRGARRIGGAAGVAVAILLLAHACQVRGAVAQPPAFQARGAVAPPRERLKGRAGAAPSAALATASAFSRAFVAGRYGAMWALLTLQARAGWSGPALYAAFYRAKFAPVLVRGVVLGAARAAGPAVSVPFSLDLVWRRAGPPGVLTLFRNLPATLVRTASGWRVAAGGPLDPAAPLIPPMLSPPRVLHVPILMYHHISSVPPLALSQMGLTVTDVDFAAELAYLAGHGYHAIRLGDLFNALDYGRALPARPIVLTFDDGYLDNYTDAFPLLRRYHMVGVFNVIVGYPGITLGVNRYMTWAQIGAMAAAGMEVESHTIDHRDLGQLDLAKLTYELRFSRAILAAHLHRAVQFLTYPSGEPFRSGTLAAQQRVLALLPECGYVGALLDPIVASSRQDARLPFELMRVRVGRAEPMAEFVSRLQLP